MPLPNFKSEIPRLYTTILQLSPGEKSLGMKISQGSDGTPKVSVIKSSGPASRSELQVGHQLLCINSHRVRAAEQGVRLFKHYLAKGAPLELLMSAGTLPLGCSYALVKANQKLVKEDGSLQGLFLEEDRKLVRVVDVSSNGLFAGIGINKRDVIMAIDEHEVRTVKGCEKALKQATRDVIPVLTYNVFRKAKSSFLAEKTSNNVATVSACENAGRSVKEKKRVFSDVYEIGRELGSGAFSSVLLATSKETREKFAVKVINRSSLSAPLKRALQREVDILRDFNHPNILRLIETYSTDQKYYLVTEILEGGELFDRIVEKSSYTESEARDLSKMLIQALEYCHLRRVAHRDLKPENILLKYRDDDTLVTIADFGLARKAPREDSLKTLCGSPMYLSPEIIKRDRYGTKTDIWSLGVIIFILLGGYPPFCDENRKIQDKLIMKSRYAFFKKYWDVVSNSARELIKSLLVVDPKERLSATEALNHPWFTAKNDSLRRNTLNSRESMAAFFVHGKKKSAFERDTEVIDTIKRLSDIIKAAVIEDNEGADDFSNKEERTEDITDESSIDSENLEPIPLINGVSIGDLNIDYELSRESMTNLKGLSTTVKSSLTQTSLVRSVRWSASPFGEKADEDSSTSSPAG